MLSETCSIEDLTKYIPTSTSITTSSQDVIQYDFMVDYTAPFEFSAIIKHNLSGGDGFNSIFALTSNTGVFNKANNFPRAITVGGYSTTIGVGYYTGTGEDFTSVNRTSHIMPNNTEYLVEIKVNNNNEIISKITRISDGSVLFTDSRTLPIDITGYDIAIGGRGNNTTTYREVKIKPL